MARDGHLRNLVLLQANDDAAPRSGARGPGVGDLRRADPLPADRKSTRLNSSHSQISYAVFCLKKKKARRSPSPTDGRSDESRGSRPKTTNRLRANLPTAHM